MNTAMRNLKIFLSLFGACILLCTCVQNYVSPYKALKTGYLVVEGYISGNSVTQYTLSRTISLPGDSAIPAESGAKVQVEGNDNSIYPLVEQTPGVYGSDTLALSTTAQYRLRISTSNGESYLSDFTAYKPTPAIDSVNWILNSNGVTIYANTHDPANSTRYYQWTYDQTWSYYSAEQSSVIYQSSTNTVIPRPLDQQDFQCWISAADANILIGSSAKLAQDVIYEFPLLQIPLNSQPLSVEYSILVKQYALTQDGYNFLGLMQSNTESLGSIFDVQPSEIIGNIHCINNPAEQVIGYISAGTVQQQRIFIKHNQVPDWFYRFSCSEPDIVVPPDSIKYYFGGTPFVPISVRLAPPGGYNANYADCIDCRSQGGTTVAPSYWPN
jgi:hypothetical protein